MMKLERFTSLASYKPWERRRLLDLAVLRNTLVSLFALGMAWVRVQQGVWPPWLILTLVPCDACLMALISADWIEHALKMLIFGYTDNPNVFARGELEGANTIMVAEQEEEWRARMWTWIAIGDDPGSRHYAFPRPWRRRWCALFRDD